MSWICVDFSHLACGATLDVFCYKGFHVWPPVITPEKVECFGNSGVSRGHMVMKKGCYSPPKIVVFHDNESGITVPVGAVQQG